MHNTGTVLAKRLRAVALVALCVIMASAMTLALSGCGSNASSDNGSSSSTSQAKYRILDEKLSTEHFGVGFKLGDTTLRDAVEYTMVGLYNDGTVQQLCDKYSDQGVNFDAWQLTSTDATADSVAAATKELGSSEKFIVGFDKEFPPYGYVGDDGQYTGFDLDLAQAVCAKNGWTFVPQPIDWDAKDAELNSGNISCIWNGFTIEGRENTYTFTQPYMDNSQVVCVKADSSINSLADLAGKTVMAQADSAALD
ncbi:MAG: transporter substrate-binding domain-containing protein, partial [Coriobacteriales bacterium]|nr:transporter substrate-binding domain-containing protein [Coriobacteriales bacterium]